MKKILSKISSKRQATLPREVMDQLNASVGDVLEYSWENGELVVRRFSAEEALYLQGMQTQLGEWEGDSDDELV